MVERTTTRATGNKTSIKRKKKMTGSSVAVLVLSIILGLSVIGGVTGAFFLANNAATGDITLGNPVDIDITQGGTNVTTLVFAGPAYPGTTYDQPISITAKANTSESCIRAKLSMTNENSATHEVTVATTATWVKGTDEYHYYKGSLTAGQTVDFVTKMTVPTTLTNEDANKKFGVSIVAEAIQKANGAAAATWTTAPDDWKTDFGGGITT